MSVKLTQPQAERLRRLLHMEYTVTELAEELGCPRRTIERAIEEGVPHRKEANRLYIVGDAFATWYRALPKQKGKKVTVGLHECYCLRCKAATPLVEESVEPNSRNVVLVKGTCGVCGAKVNRLRKQEVPQ